MSYMAQISIWHGKLNCSIPSYPIRTLESCSRPSRIIRKGMTPLAVERALLLSVDPISLFVYESQHEVLWWRERIRPLTHSRCNDEHISSRVKEKFEGSKRRGVRAWFYATRGRNFSTKSRVQVEWGLGDWPMYVSLATFGCALITASHKDGYLERGKKLNGWEKLKV